MKKIKRDQIHFAHEPNMYLPLIQQVQPGGQRTQLSQMMTFNLKDRVEIHHKPRDKQQILNGRFKDQQG